jgi:hypothetical protein
MGDVCPPSLVDDRRTQVRTQDVAVPEGDGEGEGGGVVVVDEDRPEGFIETLGQHREPDQRDGLDPCLAQSAVLPMREVFTP